ncbi:Xaa-Pro aminopeptidase [Palleronia aestuarii]|uniref:Xaa-Pro aminopeptidase n=1 Tax=Palleronia aestuarii TaxID=568105 RepID=A0A2W7N844_9RHOB|nr:aminopeptidase P family protein [Palleronia aestuarii]PZX16248.1 Xaa-Pro aminopeptidase [Palleronia aestuarii]
MFQSFDTKGGPADPARLASLREELAARGLDAILVPRADAHQGEYVAPHDARLAWLTGFTGSAGFAIVTTAKAAIFVDGRYKLQVRSEVAEEITPVDWPATRAEAWLDDHLDDGARVGFDPWLHTAKEVEALKARLEPRGIEIVPVTPNPVDAIWTDQPAPPMGPVTLYPEELAGRDRAEKCREIAETLREAGEDWAVLTLPDSICWLLNIRGSDIPRNPVAHGFAILEAATGAVRLFMHAEKLAKIRLDGVDLLPPEGLVAALATLSGKVRVDRESAPWIVGDTLASEGIALSWAPDPCLLPKARKTEAELAATRAAHLRDGAAMCAFLRWLDDAAERVVQGGATVMEIDAVRALEEFRRAGGDLLDIAFDTIAGSGPHGAIVHYRVTEATDRALAPGELLLVDSGGQYLDGTTDITRTIAIGVPDEEQIAAFTRVLKGMIAVSRARWPKGLAGRDLDALARAPLWMAGQDYDHGTGHGVGVYLSVHEGPQRLSRTSDIPLEPGMIVSNEPGYYREGAWGIRIENLVAVEPAPDLDSADPARDMLAFETLTWVPIDRRLIDVDALSPGERAWIDAYHAGVERQMTGRLDAETAAWLGRACAPL